MRYFNEFQFAVEDQDIDDLLKECKKNTPSIPNQEILKVIFSLIDLTSLSEKDNAERIGI